MAEPVYILGAGRTDFKRNLKKEGKTIRHIIVESAQAALADARIEPKDIQSGVVGNFAAGLFTRQLHLGSFLTEVDPALRGMPTLHTEAACASGAVAVMTAIQQIAGGLRDCVLVVGAEQQKTMSPVDGSDVLGAAGDYYPEKLQYGDFMFPKLFGRIAEVYTKHYGLTDEQLARVAVKNHAHARFNPLAQMRDSELTLRQASSDNEHNKRIAPPLKVTDCSQITDGAASLVLCSENFLKRIASKSPRPQLSGFGHTTDYLPLDKKDVPNFAVATKAVDQAYDMAKLTPLDLQGVEVHDCFSISEIVGYEIVGIAMRGQGAKFLDSGATALPSVRSLLGVGNPERTIVVNPGGGLMGDGHPVGATGVRQCVEAYLQLTGAGGERQIPGVRNYLTFNMGGSFTTTVALIWKI